MHAWNESAALAEDFAALMLSAAVARLHAR